MKKCLILLIPAILLHADVTKQTFTKLVMMGGMMTSAMSSTTELRAAMKADDEVNEGKALIGFRTKHMATITRLDKGLTWQVNHDRKSYTESPVAMSQNPNQSMGGSPAQPDTTRYKLVKSEFIANKLDSTKTINGYSCTAYLATWTNVIENTENRERATTMMTLKEWTTPETDILKQARAEEEAYSKAYLVKLGLGVNAEQSQMIGLQYLTMMGMNQKQLSGRLSGFGSEMAKIKGYPIVTETGWESINDTTKTPKQPESPSEALGSSIAKAIGTAPTEPASPNTLRFSSYTEVKSVNVGRTADKDYEVPEGYRKVSK